ncbi:MAG: hypothetical protein SFY68_01400 [Candidatus Sumerlaeia bacterium]|nr:hypothetical protein [Candidatus Sumerlaeia bacterium]
MNLTTQGAITTMRISSVTRVRLAWVLLFALFLVVCGNLSVPLHLLVHEHTGYSKSETSGHSHPASAHSHGAGAFYHHHEEPNESGDGEAPSQDHEHRPHPVSDHAFLLHTLDVAVVREQVIPQLSGESNWIDSKGHSHPGTPLEIHRLRGPPVSPFSV